MAPQVEVQVDVLLEDDIGLELEIADLADEALAVDVARMRFCQMDRKLGR
jgi:hypothetical protein